MPTVDDARPPITPCCGVASAPPGKPLVLHGHGTRARMVLGCLAPETTPGFHGFRVRRYLCVLCGVTCTVAPLDVLPRKHFGAITIALALAMYGVLRETLAEIYDALNPSKTRGYAARGWRSVLRWTAIASAMFPCVRPSPPEWPPHLVAERAAQTLAAGVHDESMPITFRVAHGACHPP